MKNYFKFKQFKKDIIVFFDDEIPEDAMVALNKIQALNVHDNEVSVWNIPDIAGPWQKLRAIK